MKVRKFSVELDENDYASVQAAIAKRQLIRDVRGTVPPDSESDPQGALVAEICRGYLEMPERATA